MTAPAQFIQYLRGWRESLARMVPNWMTQRPGAENGWKWLWSMVMPLDIDIEHTLQGINDWAPGSPNATPTALSLIGQSRGLLRGEGETDGHYSARLQQWRALNRERGTSERLALEVQNYLGATPTVRVIERLWSAPGATPMANYVTARPDGSTTVQQAAWDWDSHSGWTDGARTYSGDECRAFWSDTWIVVYPAKWARGASVTPLTGQIVSTASVQNILRIASDWKGAHTFVRAIIWSYNAALFDPASPGTSGNPDGWWGDTARDDGSGNSVPARNNVDARYWLPNGG